MTTTPAPTDIDTLKALEQAATPGPWEATANHRVLWMESPEDPLGLPVAETFYPNAEFIAAMRSALPALLDELAKTRADVEKLTVALDIVALREIRQAADLAIVEAELAKTRAELDAMTERRNEVRELAAKREAELIYRRTALGRAVDLMLQARHYGNLPATLRERIDAFTAEKADANPATTAEPADWDDVQLPSQGRVVAHGVLTVTRTAEPASEPKADDSTWPECGRGVRGDWCRRPVNHDGDCSPKSRRLALPDAEPAAS